MSLLGFAPGQEFEIETLSGEGWRVVLDTLTLTASKAEERGGRIVAIIEASHGGTPIHRDTVTLTSQAARQRFVNAIRKDLPPNTDIDRILVALETRIRESLTTGFRDDAGFQGAPGLDGVGGADHDPLPRCPEYKETTRGLEHIRYDDAGEEQGGTLLTNFTATIVGETLEDDGVEARRFYEIHARVVNGDAPVVFEIAASDFRTLSWVDANLGAKAVVYPRQGEHAATAIKELSGGADGKVPRHVIYVHTGWRRGDDGTWAYLHAGGAIGPNGPVSSIRVRLPEALGRYSLPAPPEGAALVEAVRASLRLIDVAPDRITLPLLAAVARAPVASADFSIHVAGGTGVGKTALAALAEQHFGAGLDARNLPGSWLSTGNALEGIAFAAKDTLLVVDDFAPTGNVYDIQRGHREADRFLRAQGNQAGRGRMRQDGSLRPTKRPRGLILSTGEDIPKGSSLRARLLILEMEPGDVDWRRMTECQQDAAAGLYAQAMAGYVRWLAKRYDEIRSALRSDIMTTRDVAQQSAAHRRTAEIVANLMVGWRFYLTFAVAVGAITDEEKQTYHGRAWEALSEATQAQQFHQQAGDPVHRFLELIRAAITSGQAHVASPDGCPPPRDSQAWGWKEFNQPLGPKIGWVQEDDLYLEPEASYKVAQQMAGNAPIAIESKTLHKRLAEAGLLRSKDRDDRHTTRETLERKRRDVLHLSIAAIFPPESDHSDQSARAGSV